MDLNQSNPALDIVTSGESIDLYQNAPVTLKQIDSNSITLIQPSDLVITDANATGQNPYFDDTPDTTTISGIALLRRFTSIDISWIESFIPSNHSHTEIWRSQIDDVNSAVCVEESRTQSCTDAIDPRYSYYYWFRPVTYSGVSGTFSSSIYVDESASTSALDSLLDLSDLNNQIDTLSSDLNELRTFLLNTITQNSDDLSALLSLQIADRAVILTDSLISVTDTIRLANETSIASIEEQMVLRIGENSAQAISITNLQASVSNEVSTRTAEITRIDGVYADLNSALAEVILRLNALVADGDSVALAEVTRESSARADGDEAIAQDLLTLTAQFTTLESEFNAALEIERVARATADSAMASQITSISAGFVSAETAINARITDELLTVATTTEALAQRITDVETDFTNDIVEVNARVTTQDLSISNSLQAFAQQVTTITADYAGLEGQVDAVSASVTSESLARASADSALALDVTNLSAEIGDVEARAQDYTLARVGYCVIGGEVSSQTDKDACEAAGGLWEVLPLSEAIDKVSVSITNSDGSTSTANAGTLFQTLADDLGNVSARAFIGTNVNGQVTGIVVTDSSGNESTSAIDIIGDRINLLNPNDQSAFISFDTVNNRAVFKGQVVLGDGTVVNDSGDLVGSGGQDGSTIYYDYQYSVDGLTNWHSPMVTGDLYRRERLITDGVPSAWSAASKIAGEDSVNAFKSIVFTRSNSSTVATPVGGSYASPLPTTSGWEDGIPAGEAQLYSSTRVFSENGLSPQQTAWTTPRALTDTATVDFEYSEINVPGDPTNNPSNWHNDATPNDIWLAQRTKVNGVFTAWNIARIKGEDGLTIYEEYQYSVNGTTGWHDDFLNGDMFRRTRTVTNGVPSAWSAAARITGNTPALGTDYFIQDGAFKSYVYITRSEGYSTPPTNSGTFDGTTETPPTGWSDNPYFTAGQITYVSSATYIHDPVNDTWAINGSWSAPAEYSQEGKAGIPSFKSVTFKRQNTAVLSTPTGGNWTSPIPTTAGWEDGVPSGEEKLWQSTRIFTQDGSSPQQSTWTTPRVVGDTGTIDFEFSNVVSNPGNPTDNPSNWHNTAAPDDIWMAVRKIQNGAFGAWEITKIKGETGERGNDGDPGDPGLPKYTWIKYSPNPDGTDLTDTPEADTMYIGLAPNQDSATESTNPALYTWGKFIGDTPVKGEDYFDGEDGLNGNFVSFVFIAVNLGTTPNAPSGGSFNGTTEVIPPSWSDDPVYSVNKVTWVSKRTYSQNTNLSWSGNAWSAPSKFYEQGADGTPGSVGAGFYTIVNADGVFPLNSVATSEFTATFGNPPKEHDHLTYVNADNSNSSIKRYDGNGWVAPTLVVNGDVLTKGTITADKINVIDLFARNINLTHSLIVNQQDTLVRMSAESGQEGLYASYQGQPYFIISPSQQLFNGNGLMTGSVKADSLHSSVIDLISNSLGASAPSGGGFFDDEFYFKYQVVNTRANITGVVHAGNPTEIRLNGGCYWGSGNQLSGSARLRLQRSPNAANSWTTLIDETITIESTLEPEENIYINTWALSETITPTAITGTYDYRVFVDPVNSDFSQNVNCTVSVFEEASGGSAGSDGSQLLTSNNTWTGLNTFNSVVTLALGTTDPTSTAKYKMLKWGSHGSISQISGRGGTMLTSGDDALVLSCGDKGRTFTTADFNPLAENVYALSDSSFIMRLGLQGGWSTSTDIEFTTSGITYNGNTVYHAGNKPTAAAIGALRTNIQGSNKPWEFKEEANNSFKIGHYDGAWQNTLILTGTTLQVQNAGTIRTVYHTGNKPSAADVNAYTKAESDARNARVNARTDGYVWVRRSSTSPPLFLTQQSTGHIASFRSGAGDGTEVAYIKRDGAIKTPYIQGIAENRRTKLMLWGNSTYGIGMGNSYTYGYLNGYATTFQMNNTADRGWWWGQSSQSNAQGAMSLTTDGRLWVEQSIHVNGKKVYHDDYHPQADRATRADRWYNSRTLSLTGDVTGTSAPWDGSGNLSFSTNIGANKVTANELAVTGNGTTSQYLRADADGTFSWATPPNTIYQHPSHPSDDINLDTGALPGATVISDLDFNVTTDDEGHVTDANASYATKTITAALVGALTQANADIRYAYKSHTHSAADITSGTLAVTRGGTGVTTKTGTGSNVLSASPTFTGTATFSRTTASNWYYSTGATGWYNNTYKGGIYMSDTDWVRVSGAKKFYVSSTSSSAIKSNGGVYANGTISGAVVTQRSDKRVKNNLVPITSALDKVCALNGYTYYRTDLRKASAGIIAQDLQKVLPEAVEADSKSGLLNVDTQAQIGLLVEAIKELQAKVTKLEGAQ